MAVKTEVVQTRITPQQKMAIDKQVLLGKYKTRSELYGTALNLFASDTTGLFKDVSKHYTENYVLLTDEQYKQAKSAYHDLEGALHALTVLTDDYVQGGPTHYKDILRDYLLPRLYDSLLQYEASHDVPLDSRVTG